MTTYVLEYGLYFDAEYVGCADEFGLDPAAEDYAERLEDICDGCHKCYCCETGRRLEMTFESREIAKMAIESGFADAAIRREESDEHVDAAVDGYVEVHEIVSAPLHVEFIKEQSRSHRKVEFDTENERTAYMFGLQDAKGCSHVLCSY